MNQIKKVAVVSGAATGIGRAAACRLAQDGFDLAICDWNQAEGQKTQSLCQKAGVQCEFALVDRGQGDQVKGFFDQIVAKYQKIDFYFNNQGVINHPQDLADTSLADFEKVVHSNFKGCFLGLKYCLQIMKQQNYGKILVTGSSAGIRPESGFGVYSATKFAVTGLVKDAAMEYGRYNIKINVICPGGIMTPLTKDTGEYLQRSDYQLPHPVEAVIKGKYEYLGSTDDLVEVVSLMAGKGSDYMTGAAISIDGGITL